MKFDLPDARDAWEAIATADRLRADARARLPHLLEEAVDQAIADSGAHPGDVRKAIEDLVARRASQESARAR